MHRVFGVAETLAQDKDRRQGGEARRDVNHGSPGEVDSAHALGVAEPAGRGSVGVHGPDPVSQGRVHQRGPQQHEQTIRPELDALGQSTADERWSDDREHPLVHAVQQDRDIGAGEGAVDPGTIIVKLDESFPLQTEQVGVPADPAALAGAEGEAVADQHPLDADDA